MRQAILHLTYHSKNRLLQAHAAARLRALPKEAQTNVMALGTFGHKVLQAAKLWWFTGKALNECDQKGLGDSIGSATR